MTKALTEQMGKGVRGYASRNFSAEDSLAELCLKEGIAQSLQNTCPNEMWQADFTYFKSTCSDGMYPSAVLDD